MKGAWYLSELTMAAIAQYGRRALLLIGLCCGVAGCGDGIRGPSAEELSEFQRLGPGGPVVDLDRVAQARLQTGLYHVVPGDVLELDMPVLLYPEITGVQVTASGRTTYNCRVSDTGTITLPDGRQIVVSGRSLAEVESTVVDAYYPRLVKTRPSVYARVQEYATVTLRVMGAVKEPGLYHLRYDQRSLVALLMEAGGIVDGGAAMIRIIRSDEADQPPHSLTRPAFSPSTDFSGSVRQTSLVSWRDLNDEESPFRLPVAISVLFQKEGPLETTGWLTIKNSEKTLVHQWLDLASQSQRRTVLAQADGGMNRLPIGQLDTRLSRLAGVMDSRSVAGDNSDVGWITTPTGAFATFLGGSLAHTAQTAGLPGGLLKKTVYASPAALTGNGQNSVSLILPVRGLNIPFADVPIGDGDTIIVERLVAKTISVLGLVARPGSFVYPPDTQYTLAEALALAGGVDMVADPRYVTVYRLRGDGTVASVVFQFARDSKQKQLTDALAMEVKPGDVISVEHTARTRSNVFLDRIFRISLGWYANPESWWN
jgi:protein involved in polysaccharide export with SLBB domain